MKSSSSFQLTLPKSFLIVGPPGTGKTTLALQLPKPALIDCDGNMSGPVRYLTEQKKLQSFSFDTPLLTKDDKPCPRELQAQRCVDLIGEAMADPNIETVIVDSLSSFVRMMMIQTLIKQGKKLGPNVLDLDAQFTQPDWGAFATLFTKTFFWMKAFNKRLVFTGHIDIREDELTKSLMNFIAIPGQLKTTLSGYFEEVWLAYIETTPGKSDVKRKLRTVTDARSTNLGLKTSCGLGNTFDADMSEIIKKLTPSP